MELSFADVLTNEMISTLGSIKTEVREMFKNKQPYRTVKVSEADRIADYLSRKAVMSPEVDAQLTNDFGETYQNYKGKMESRIRGYNA